MAESHLLNTTFHCYPSAHYFKAHKLPCRHICTHKESGRALTMACPSTDCRCQVRSQLWSPLLMKCCVRSDNMSLHVVWMLPFLHETQSVYFQCTFQPPPPWPTCAPSSHNIVNASLCFLSKTLFKKCHQEVHNHSRATFVKPLAALFYIQYRS